ncbi:MAG: hypothetical protein GY711_29495 [bacterium]|nr:hypothetical protein [bacterium]
MSGFVAVAAPPEARPDDRVLDAARTLLAHRGGDGEGSWREGGVALEAQVRRVDDPGERDESQPFVLPDGPLALASDARLDNRDELTEALALDRPNSHSDASLIAHAYRKWGEGCARRLEGDFAFALWDGARRVLFAARDALGARPLAFHRANGQFACASEIKALLELPAVPREIDRVRVGGFLEMLMDDPRRTFFEGIERLAPGHWLEWNGEKLRIERYHAFDPERRLPRAKGEEHAQAFHDHFRRAVRARLRGAPPLACLLSGGLDTSSIVAMARTLEPELPVDAYSAVFDVATECDERPQMEHVLALGGIRQRLFHAEQVSPLADWERILWYQDEALYCANFYLNWGLYRIAAADGQRVVLDGWGGDSAVGYGFERLAHLALRGRWPTLARELTALSPRVERSRGKLLRHMVLRPLRARLRAVVPKRREARLAATTRREFALATELDERVLARDRRLAKPALSAHEAWHREFATARFAEGFEDLDRAALAHGLEPRYPLLDRRLLEFCSALPEDERLRDGWPRSIHRRALRGVLPDATRTRPWKADLAPAFIQGLLKHEGERLHALADGSGPLDEFVDRDELRKVVARLFEQRRDEDAVEITKCLGLSLWLDAFRQRPISRP